MLFRQKIGSRLRNGGISTPRKTPPNLKLRVYTCSIALGQLPIETKINSDRGFFTRFVNTTKTVSRVHDLQRILANWAYVQVQQVKDSRNINSKLKLEHFDFWTVSRVHKTREILGPAVILTRHRCHRQSYTCLEQVSWALDYWFSQNDHFCAEMLSKFPKIRLKTDATTRPCR